MSDLGPFDSQRLAAEPQRSVWVAASAGSGKTKVLTDRVLRLLLDGASPGRILCLTFTRAAAAEMATRIAGRLASWAVEDDAVLVGELTELTASRPSQTMLDRARRLFATVLDTPGGLSVQTIHGFCQSILQRFPLEAGLPPGFTVLDERTATERLMTAFHLMIQDARADRFPELPEALSELSARSMETALAPLIGDFLAERGKLRKAVSVAGGLAALESCIRERHGIRAGETDRSIRADACLPDTPEMRDAVEALSKGNSTDKSRAAKIEQWLDNPTLEGEGYSIYRSVFLTNAGTVRNVLATKAAERHMPKLWKVLTGEAALLAHIEARRKAFAAASRTIALVRVASHVLDIYETGNRRHGFVDFDNLILAVRDLLTRPGIAPWVLFKLDGGIDHILIDEAQDTNPEQWQIVEAITGDFFSGAGGADARGASDRTVFAVGDTKQSIFSFQRADPQGFLERQKFFGMRVTEAGKDWSDVRLDMSFRSTQAVLEAVDAVFNTDLARDGVVADGTLHHLCFREGQAGRVEIWAPEESDDDGDADWAPPVRQRPRRDPVLRLAQRIAEQIRNWLDDGNILEARGRPIRPSDIMILVRRRGTFVPELARALKDKGVDVAGVDRMVLTDQLAVMDLVALGQFLVLPEDDLTVATVLKGPLVGLSEDALYDLCHDRGNRRVWHELNARASERSEFATASAFLNTLLERTDFTRPYEMFAEILADGGRQRLLERLGPEAADPLDEFLIQALAYEQVHVPSLQGFLHWLAASEFEVKRDLETGGSSQVRIMTVHGSKGLQAPIVFLPDAMQVPRGTDPLLWTAADDGSEIPIWLANKDSDDLASAEAREMAENKRNEEYRRLLYVGMTRAEDRLYVAGWRNRRQDRAAVPWHDMVWDGLRPVAEVKRDRLVLSNSQTAAPRIVAQADSRPAALPALPDWARTPARADQRSARPLRPSRPDDDPPVRSPFESGDSRRFLRGRIIHYLLQWLPQVSVDERLDAARGYLARPLHDLAPEEQAQYADEVMVLIGDERFADLFSPAAIAEVPIVGMIGEGAEAVVVSGQIDRLLVRDHEVFVVDFKTNRPPPDRVEKVSKVYLRQMAIYRDLLCSLYPDRAVRCALLWTDDPSLMDLPDRFLDELSLQARG